MKIILKTFFLTILSLLVLVSFADARTIKAPKNYIEEWKAPKWEKISKTKDTTWEIVRGSPIDTSRAFTLAELVDIALTNSPLTQQSWLGARAQEMQVKQAESSWYPHLAVSADFDKDKRVSSYRENDVNSIDYGPSGKLTFLLFDFGGRDASTREAIQTLLAANFQFNQSIQDLLLAVEESYYGLYSAQSTLEAADADVADAEATFIAAQEKFQVGVVSKLDELQARSNYDNALFMREEARGNLKTAEADLAKTLGLPADTQIKIVPPSKEASMDVTEEDVSQIIEEALVRRPDISAARANLKAKKAAVTAAASDLWPSLNFEGAAGRTWYEFYGDNKRDEHDYSYSTQVSVDWDIFDGFNNYAQMREARENLKAEREKLKQTELEASRDVWTKYYNFRTAIRKLVYSRAFLDTAKASHELAMESYNAGLKSILDLLNAQSNLSDARSKLIQSEKDLFIAFAELAHATGSLHINMEEQ